MAVVNVVRRNLFRDSIQLMRLTEEAKKLEGVEDAVVAMGTETNKHLLHDLGLIGPESKGAAEGDLMMAVKVAQGRSPEEVMAKVEQLVMAPPTPKGGARGRTFHSLTTALESLVGTNLAVVSVPGRQAFAPSMELLKNGVNVHLFSDHVSITEERQLKTYASSRGLVVLGPGAGTSIINGVGLGFANAVRRGHVGIVASAGTGVQEAAILLDRAGLGVSHALGVGGTDVSRDIGGLMMKDCLRMLEGDPATRTLLLIAKAPAESVFREVMRFVERETTKPVVACFLGLASPPSGGRRVAFAATLHSAVGRVAKAGGRSAQSQFVEKVSMEFDDLTRASRSIAAKGKRRYVRGLYSGGTLAHETLLIFRELFGEAYSNTPLSSKFELADPNVSRENSVVDLGDEFFTAGRAHPMIDPTLRRLRMVQECRDPEVRAVMLDVVLGYGSSADPGGALLSAVEGAVSKGVAVLAHVCGTEADPQSLADQEAKLTSAGAVLYPSNCLMACAAALAVGGAPASARLKQKWEELIG